MLPEILSVAGGLIAYAVLWGRFTQMIKSNKELFEGRLNKLQEQILWKRRMK
jgi:hypothetical protein